MPSPTLAQVLHLEIPVVVRVGERPMSLRDVISLVPGSIIQLPKNANAELDLLCNDKAIGCGNAVKVGENFGIRITYMGDVKQRSEALAAVISDDEAAATALAEQLLSGQL
jgi:flagellar motor switch protein FliN/FliY